MKSPLKSKPLRTAGQSSESALQDLLLEGALQPMFIAAFLVALAVVEWWRWWASVPPSPWLHTAIAVISVIYALACIRRTITKARRIKLGRDGERAVGQFLEDLRRAGAAVFHDVPGTGFNLDHVVIHTTGLYVVETKTLSKPDRGEAKLIYDGTRVTRRGLELDRNPVVQARAAAKWLSELLKESTGRSFPVRPVVVYPGWFIESTAEGKSSDVWVLNPKALPSFISNSPTRLAPEDVNLCTFHLSRYVRISQ